MKRYARVIGNSQVSAADEGVNYLIAAYIDGELLGYVFNTAQSRGSYLLRVSTTRTPKKYASEAGALKAIGQYNYASELYVYEDDAMPTIKFAKYLSRETDSLKMWPTGLQLKAVPQEQFVTGAESVTAGEGTSAYDKRIADMQAVPAFQELEAKCAANGYRLYSAFIDSKNNIHVTLYSENPRQCPEVRVVSKSGSNNVQIGDVGVLIDTISIGSIGLVDYIAYMSGVEAAYEVGKFLENWDKWDKLYLYSDNT